MEFNKDILRWVLLLGAAPIWIPFLRILWRDFNEALREEGGLFGRAPTPRELEQIRREKLTQPDTLVSEPWVRAGEKRVSRMRSPDSRGGPRPGAGPSGPRPRGFR
jgi:hypothetical protein